MIPVGKREKKKKQKKGKIGRFNITIETKYSQSTRRIKTYTDTARLSLVFNFETVKLVRKIHHDFSLSHTPVHDTTHDSRLTTSTSTTTTITTTITITNT